MAMNGGGRGHIELVNFRVVSISEHCHDISIRRQRASADNWQAGHSLAVGICGQQASRESTGNGHLWAASKWASAGTGIRGQQAVAW